MFNYVRTQRTAVQSGAVEVRRGPLVESRHVVHVAVVDAGGRVVARCGDTQLVTYARSAIKPMQALPLVEDEVAARFGLDDEELALACASHSGEPEHVTVARRMLAKVGLGEDALACGAHAPFHRPSARALQEAGTLPGRLHNNCSGKHAGMLALARAHGWEVRGYQTAGHPVQQRMLHEMARWCDVAPSDIVVGVDGCGVATFAVALEALAGGFARLAAADAAGEVGPNRILDAMRAHPRLVAGTGRFCTVLMEVTAGRVVAKVGAEGVYGAMMPDAGLGIALKVADGGRRAAEPALVGALAALNLLGTDELSRLQSFAAPALSNTRGEEVGEVRAVMALERCS